MNDAGSAPSADFDLSVPVRVHIVGIGGAGMSAIASVLAAMGHPVTGSDLKESPGLDRLRALGVGIEVGHDAAHLGDAQVVTVSTAIPPRNPEIQAARARGIPVLRRAEILALLSRTRRSIAVAGTHGKTTTSSMLALALVEASLRPSFIIGGDVNEIGSGAVWDSGELFVVEADESDGTFLEIDADTVVVTNIEPDHLDHYGGFANLEVAFERFARAASGSRVLCADDENTRTLIARLRADGVGLVSYGTADDADVRITAIEREPQSTRAVLLRNGAEIGRLELPVPGLHNLRNATAAMTAALEVGASFDAARRALGRFGGVARRFEHRGEVAGVTFVDDYAHLATEVRAALEAARSGNYRRVVCVFQPHRYSRTRSLWQSFADAFVDADLLVVTDVYPSNERPIPGVTGKLVVNAVLDEHAWTRVAYLPFRRDVVRYLVDELRPGDLCLSLGAGDLTLLPDELQPLLAAKYAVVAR
ncbi:MAG: UDP-N-acetylmuramate--L-alanine ligase [Acidimicrobiales bacterium]